MNRVSSKLCVFLIIFLAVVIAFGNICISKDTAEISSYNIDETFIEIENKVYNTIGVSVSTTNQICVESIDYDSVFTDSTDYNIKYDFSDTDKELLLRIAMSEARGQGIEGMALIMLVVINRVQSEEFPDSITKVIFAENQFYTEGMYALDPSEDCYEALELVMSGWDESEGALYFENTSSTSSWHSDNLTYLFTYKDHIFYN